jgi:DnaJ homolog subfamily C member 28
MQNVDDKTLNITIKENILMYEAQLLVQRNDRVGALLAEAIKRGEFDNLEGAGKPLNLEDNPLAPDEMHMAYKILKDNGFAPYWIELGKEIHALRAKLNQEIDYFKRYTQIGLGEKRSYAAMRRYEIKKNDFYDQCRGRLVEISKKILDYNLNCPVSHLGRANFDIDDEMSSIIKEIEPLSQD